MKIVLDTNVLVSAILKPGSNPARILRLVLQGDIYIVVNSHILAEYYEVLRRPKSNLDIDFVDVVLEFIRAKGINAPALAETFFLPDSTDEPFLEAALAARADALITGNIKHFPKKSCKGQNVVSTMNFLNELSQ